MHSESAEYTRVMIGQLIKYDSDTEFLYKGYNVSFIRHQTLLI